MSIKIQYDYTKSSSEYSSYTSVLNALTASRVVADKVLHSLHRVGIELAGVRVINEAFFFVTVVRGAVAIK